MPTDYSMSACDNNMNQILSQREWGRDEQHTLPTLPSAICNLQSAISNLMMAAHAKMEPTEVDMNTTMPVRRTIRLVFWRVMAGTVARCVTAVSRMPVRHDRSEAAVAVSAIAVVGMTTAIHGPVVPAAVSVSSAVSISTGEIVARLSVFACRQHSQGSNRSRNYQESFHFQDPVGVDGREQGTFKASAVPNPGTRLKHSVSRHLLNSGLHECSQNDSSMSSFWCHLGGQVSALPEATLV